MTKRSTISQADIGVLRRVAEQVRRIADSELMAERRRLWTHHNDLDSRRPMILAEIGGVMDEIRPLITVQCQGQTAQCIEFGLRSQLYQFEQVGDDCVIEPYMNCAWHLQIGDYGVAPEIHRADNDGHLGARNWDAPLKDLQTDFDKLRPRTFAVDREATYRRKDELEQIFGDILPVRIRGSYGWTMGMTMTAIDLIGLQNLMLFMYDDPDGLHRLMRFLCDDHMRYLDWMETEDLLTLNNENDYIGSGSLGYTEQLPQSDWAASKPVRLKDLWVLSESQETVGVGPDLFEEFIFPYQRDLVKRFGLCYYGCCEPVHTRWHVLRKLPRLRKVSISPWCDQAFMASEMGADYVFCRKPNPTLISTETFDEAAIREDLRETLDTAAGCPVEIVMKDVHTLQNRPERLGRWVQLVREEAERT